MDDLIKALTILRKYDNPESPTHCEHDVLFVDIDPEQVSAEDIAELRLLGFVRGTYDYANGFISYRFGSC